MAGVITNLIKTKFTTEGAKRTEQATQRVGRAQTRLGQASAASGRQFAAQSDGLGGLVGAYAGAAATIFAVSAAYDALARSARASQTLEGLTAIAANSAVAGDALLASVNKITKGQLTFVESAEQINLSLSAGFGAEQIEGLAGVAIKASRALGRDLSDAMTRVVRGSAKMEAELLDELGIYTKIDPATRAYAAAIGKTVGELTEYERRQGFVNAVITEGEKKFSSINTTIPTSSQKIEAFSKTILNLTTNMGMLIADGLAPLASFLTNNLSATLGTVALLGSLVLGKGISVLKGQLDNFQAAAEKKAASVNNAILGLNKGAVARVAEANKAVSGINKSASGLSGIGPELKGLVDVSRQRNLSNIELKESGRLLGIRATNLDTNITKMKANVAALEAQTKSSKLSSKAMDANLEQRNSINKSIETQNGLLAQTKTQLNAVNTASKGATVGLAKFAAAGVLNIGKALAGIGSMALGIVSFGAVALSAVAIGGILGSTFFNLIGKSEEYEATLKKGGKALKNLFNDADKGRDISVLQGVSSRAISEIESTNKELRELDSFKFESKFMLIDIEIEKTKEQLANEVNEAVVSITNNRGNTMLQTAGSDMGKIYAGALAGAAAGALTLALPGAIAGALVGAGLGATYNIRSAISIDLSESDMSALNDQLGGALDELDGFAKDTAAKLITSYREQYEELAKIDPQVRLMLDTITGLAIESSKWLEYSDSIYDVMQATGQTADNITKNFTFINQLDEARKIATTIAGIDFSVMNVNPINLTEVLDAASIDPNLRSLNKLTVDLEGSNAVKSIMVELETSAKSFRDILANLDLSPHLNAAFLDVGEEAIKAYTSTKDYVDIINVLSRDSNSLNGGLLRTAEVLRASDEGISNNAITVEQLSQNIGNASSSIDTMKGSYAELVTELGILTNMNTTELPDGVVNSIENRIQSLRNALGEATSSLTAQVRLVDVLTDQLEAYSNRKDIADFVTSITPKGVTDFDLELQISTVGVDNELLAQIDYLNNIVSAGEQATHQFDEMAGMLNRFGDGSLSNDLVASVLGATSAEIGDYKQQLLEAGMSAEQFADIQSLAVTESMQQLKTAADQAGESIDKFMGQLASEAIKEADKLLREYATTIKDIDLEIAAIETKSAIATIKFELDSSQITRDIQLAVQEFELDNIKLQIDLVQATEGAENITAIEAAKQETALQQQLLDKRVTIAYLEFENEVRAIEARNQLLVEDMRINNAKIEADALQLKIKIASDIENITNLSNLYSEYITSQGQINQSLVNGMLDASVSMNTSFAQTFSSAASTLNQAIIAGFERNPYASPVVAGTTERVAIDPIETAFSDLASSVGLAGLEAMNKIDERSEAQIKAETARVSEQLTLNQLEIDASKINLENRLSNLALDRQIEAQNAQTRASDAGGKAETDKLKERIKELFDAMKGHVESALMSLNDLIFYGEGDFGEIMGGMFKSMQQDFFKQTVADPLSGFLTDSVFSMFGVTNAKKGVDGMTYNSSGALLVSIIGGPEGLFSDSLGGAPETGEDSVVNKVTTQVTGIFDKIFGSDGLFSSIFKNLGSMFSGGEGGGGFFSSIFKGIFGMFGSGAAQGGMIHMAQGGMTPAVMRDRVPTMLEPGEFVIRKQMARAIGAPALQNMNATGRVGGGAPTINFVNQGSPKEVESAEPRFDGEKYIIDVVARDIRNNGTLRRTLRGK